LLKLQGPLGQFQQAIRHGAHLKVRVVLAEGVYRFFHENGLDKVEAISKLHHWDQFVEVQGQWFLEVLGEMFLKIASCRNIHAQKWF
jgi:hypothetical protein